MANANVEMNERILKKKTQTKKWKRANWKNWNQEKRRWGKKIEKENEREKGWKQKIKSDTHELKRWQWWCSNLDLVEWKRRGDALYSLLKEEKHAHKEKTENTLYCPLKEKKCAQKESNGK
jgi:hypothetical protein